MIRIEEITLDGFKGQQATHKLGKLNLVTGENGAGKSAITLAAMFACTGCTPDGKRLDNVLEYAGPRGCSVGIRFADGGGFSRRLEVDNRDGRLSQTIDLLGRRDQLGLKAAEAALEATIGRAPEMWNVNEFLNMSAEQKRRYLLRLFASTSIDAAADPGSLLARIVAEYLRRCRDGGESVADSLIAFMEQSPVADRLNQALSQAKATISDAAEFKSLAGLIERLRESITGDIAQAASAMVEAATRATNSAKADHDAARKALEEISAHKATLAVVATQAAELRAKDEQLARDLAQVIQAIGQAEGRIQAETAIGNRLAAAEQAAADNRNRLRELTESPPSATKENADALMARADRIDRGARLRELEAEANRLRAVLTMAAENPASPDALEAEANGIEAAMPDINDGQRQAAQDKAESFASQAAGLSRKYSAANNEAISLRGKRDALAKELERAGQSPWREAQTMLAAAEGRFPEFAEYFVQALAPLRAFIEKQIGNDDTAAIESQIKSLALAIQEAELQRDEAKAEHGRCLEAQIAAENEARRLRNAQSEARSDREAGLRRIADLRAQAVALREQAGNAVDARAETDARIREIGKQIAALTADGVEFITGDQRADAAASNLRKEAELIHAKLIDYADALRETRRCIEIAESRAASDKAELAALAPAGDLDGLKAKRAALEAARAELAGQIKARADFEAAERCYAETESKARSKCIDWETAKIVVKAVQAMRDEMMGRLSKPATDRMNRFLNYCCVGGEQAYCDIESSIGREICEFGWVRRDRKISIRAMCGGERTMFAPALQYAMVTLADTPLKLLLIEADQCDFANLIRLLTACEAVADDLSNIIVTTHAGTQIAALSNWNIIRCGEQADEAAALAEAVKGPSISEHVALGIESIVTANGIAQARSPGLRTYFMRASEP